MPAVAGGWRKGMDRRGCRDLPLTAEVVAAHLVGDVFMGLYPLLPGQHVPVRGGRLRRRDGDARRARLRQGGPGQRRAGRAGDLPVGTRRPRVDLLHRPGPGGRRRGRSAPCCCTRRWCCAGRWTCARTTGCFPNQDVLPEGGFGNLIAAPLQGRRRKDGLTTFLDLGTLEPYEDQWAFLSTLDRLSPGDAERVARRREAATSGGHRRRHDEPVRRNPGPSRLPAVVHAELGAGLSLDAAQLTPAALATFKHAAAMANPKFYELQRLRKSTWDTPTVHPRLRPHPRRPPGPARADCGTPSPAIVERAGSRLAVTDVRNPGREIDVAFTAELTTEQSSRGRRAARPRRRGARRPARIRQDGHGLRRDRRARHLHPGPRRPQSPGRPVAHPDRTVPRHPSPANSAAAGAKLTGTVDIALLPSLARRDDVAALDRRLRARHRRRVPPPRRRRVRALGQRIAAQFWLGLTATPTRRDGLGQLVTWQLGPVRHTMTDEEQGTLAAAMSDGRRRTTTRAATSTRPRSSPATWTWTRRARSPRCTGRLPSTSRATPRSPTTSPRALARGRNCLVLTRRVAHVEALAAMLAARGHRPLVLQGAMSTTDRRAAVDRLDEAKAGDGLLVIGTTPFIGEGFDAPALDTLFLAGPISFDGLLVQCAGRVVRAAPGKDVAEVHDYHDPAVPLLAASLQRRMPGYRALGFVRKT